MRILQTISLKDLNFRKHISVTDAVLRIRLHLGMKWGVIRKLSAAIDLC
jgi:hypothetical protein